MRRRSPFLLAVALLAACAPEGGGNADADADWRAHSVIQAREGLMIEMQVQMLEIDKAAGGDPFDIRAARVRAGAISAMLVALPHMFPEGTDSESTAHLPSPSLALPVLWEDRSAFEAMAERIQRQASALVAISDEDAFRARAVTLRAGCDHCHALYQKGYVTPPVSQNDG